MLCSAEKIYKIQKELQEKKNRRLNEQNSDPRAGPSGVMQMGHAGMVSSMLGAHGSMANGPMDRSGPSTSYGSYSSMASNSQPMMSAASAQQQQQHQRPHSQQHELLQPPMHGQAPAMHVQEPGTSAAHQQQQQPPMLMSGGAISNIKNEIPDLHGEIVSMGKQEANIKQEAVDVKPERPLAAASNATAAVKAPAPRQHVATASTSAAKPEPREEVTLEEKVFDASELRT